MYADTTLVCNYNLMERIKLLDSNPKKKYMLKLERKWAVLVLKDIFRSLISTRFEMGTAVYIVTALTTLLSRIFSPPVSSFCSSTGRNSILFFSRRHSALLPQEKDNKFSRWATPRWLSKRNRSLDYRRSWEIQFLTSFRGSEGAILESGEEG